MEQLTVDSVRSFLDRFYQLNDALMVSVLYDWLWGGGTILSVTVEARDQTSDEQTSLVRLRMSGLEEVVFREVNTSIQCMSSGLTVKWFDDLIWLSFQPYSTKLDSPADFRKSYFYVATRTCHWEVVPRRTTLLKRETTGDAPPE